MSVAHLRTLVCSPDIRPRSANDKSRSAPGGLHGGLQFPDTPIPTHSRGCTRPLVQQNNTWVLFDIIIHVFRCSPVIPACTWLDSASRSTKRYVLPFGREPVRRSGGLHGGLQFPDTPIPTHSIEDARDRWFNKTTHGFCLT